VCYSPKSDRKPMRRRVDRLVKAMTINGSPKAQIFLHDHSDFANALRTTRSTFDQRSLALPRHSRVQLISALEMFFGQLGHTKVLEPACNHPMEKWIIGGELIGLPFMHVGFLDLA
jgi:hypothetical protein